MNLQSEDILDLISSHKQVVTEAKKYRDFESGDALIKQKQESKLGGASNKVAVNFARKIKTNIDGYFFGNAFKLTHKTDENLQEFFDEMFTYNNKENLIGELSDELLDVGKAYWLLYIDNNKYLKIQPVPVEEVIYIKNERYMDEPEMAIRYFYREGRNINKAELNVEVYTKDEVYYFTENTKGELVPDYTRGNPVVRHIFGHVPVIEFLNNRKGQSEYHDIYDLSNLYNTLFNAGADETEDIRNAYLKAINTTISDEVLLEINRTRIIEIESHKEFPADISFLTKNVDTTSFENYLALTRRLIFEIACVPDTTNLNQKTQEMSARAMKQLLRELENKCKIKERKMIESLYQFLRVVRRYVVIKAGLDYKLSDWDLQFVRNTPTTLELETISDWAILNASNKIDTETMLNMLPFIKDAQNVIEKRAIEDRELLGLDYQNLHDEEY